MDNQSDVFYHDASQWAKQFGADLFKEASSYFNCIKPLLNAMKWRHEDRSLFEALPYKATRLDFYGLLRAMDLMNFEYSRFNISLAKLDHRLMPSLFVNNKEEAFVILDSNEKEMTLFSGIENKTLTVPLSELSKEKWNGTVLIFSQREKPDMAARNQENWFFKKIKKFKLLFFQVFAISFFLNLLMLATPLFIMVVYDRVIGSSSVITLVGFSIGVIIALLGGMALQTIRSRILAFIGAQMDVTVGNAIMQQIFYLSPSYIENASIGSQLARIKDFDNLREFFTGPVISLIFEFPFIFIFIFVIWLLGGAMVWIPLIMMVLFSISSIVSRIYIKKKLGRSTNAYLNQQKMLIEIIANIRTIKLTHAERVWLDRFKSVAADTAFLDYRSNIIMGVVSSLSDASVIVAALAVLGFGVLKILAGTLTVGAMIAIMILLWRVLGPLKTIYTTITQLDQIQSSIAQLNNLMRIIPEQEAVESREEEWKPYGHIHFHNVSFRYTPHSDPSLLGINLKVDPGVVTAFTGSTAGGKSTLLKLILGMYKPQIGYIHLDGRDIRQMNPVQLRQKIAYVPDELTFFYGTIEQNLRLAKPDAIQNEIEEALKMADVYEQVMALPEGLKTMLRKSVPVNLPIDFQRKIELARAFLKASPILLIDDIFDDLDMVSQEKITASIDKVKKGRTIILCAKSPVPLNITDRIVVFKKGSIIKDGPRKAILPDLLF